MTDRHYQLIGWLLFIVCALFYTLAALQSGDLITLIGSVIFLVACIVFMIPLLRKTRK